MASFGETLRRERELRRIELREVTLATKIPLRYLEALERNDFTYLPGGVHARNFVRLCARYIGADETELVNAYLYELNLKKQSAPGGLGEHPAVVSLREHFQVAAGLDARRRRRARLAVIAGLIAALLLLIAAGFYGGRMILRSFSSPPAQEQVIP